MRPTAALLLGAILLSSLLGPATAAAADPATVSATGGTASVASVATPSGAIALAGSDDQPGWLAPASWIVRLSPASQPAAASAAALRAGGPVERRIGRRVAAIHTYTRALTGFAALLTGTEAAALRGAPGVLSVTRDLTATLDDTQAGATWGLDRIDQRDLPLTGAFDHDPSGGAGVRAYVIDTGVLTTHTEFAGRLEAGISVAPGTLDATDCQGHGTHVAGTVGGTTWGVAKAVTIVPVRVFGCTGSAPYSVIIAGIDWVIADHVSGPAVANLSLGGQVDPAMDAAIEALIADGVTVVVAAGNSATDACTASPADVPAAITVGATGTTDAGAAFGNEGSCLDLFAPGVAITSAGIGSDTASVVMSGTSMASPHVAGAAAVLLGRHPDASPAMVAAMLGTAASTGQVTRRMASSPDRLLRIAPEIPGSQSVTVLAPTLYTAEPDGAAMEAAAEGGGPVAISVTTPSVCAVEGMTVRPLEVGACGLEAAVAAVGGWDAVSVGVTIQVHAQRQSISAAPSDELRVGERITAGAAATSGLPTSLATVTPGICTVSGMEIRPVGVGVCRVRATQSGNDTWGPAEPVWLTRIVQPGRQEIHTTGSDAVDAGLSAPWTAESSAGLPVTVTVATPRTCAYDPASGTIAGLAAGDCALAVEQAGSARWLPATNATLSVVSTEPTWFTALAVPADGRPVVLRAEAERVVLLLCVDAACAASREVVLDELDSGESESTWDVALTTDAAGRAFAAWIPSIHRPKQGGSYDDWDQPVRVAACADRECSSFTRTTVLGAGPEDDLQANTVTVALASGSTRPFVAVSGDNFGSVLLRCEAWNCVTPALRTIAGTWPSDYGIGMSVAADSAGRAVLAYGRVGIDDSGTSASWTTTVLARCGNLACTTISRTAVGDGYRWHKTAVVVPPDERPVAFWIRNEAPSSNPGFSAVRSHAVMVARCFDAACGSATTSTLARWVQPGTTGDRSAIDSDLSAGLAPDGLPVVAFNTWAAATTTGPAIVPSVVACLDSACAHTSRAWLDEAARNYAVPFRAAPSLGFAPDGTARVLYSAAEPGYPTTDPTRTGVRLATCPNATCADLRHVTVSGVSAATAPDASFTSPGEGSALTGAAGAPYAVAWAETAADGRTITERDLRLESVAATAPSGCSAASGWTTTPVAAPAPGVVVSLPAAGHCVRFRLLVTDSAGDMSAAQVSGAIWVVEAGSIRVNAGALWTRSRSVSLVIKVPTGATGMRIANSSAGLDAAPVRPATSLLAWTLPSVDGAHTVWVRFTGSAMGTLTRSDAITLDTARPTAVVTDTTTTARYADGSRSVRVAIRASGTGSPLVGCQIASDTLSPGAWRAWANPVTVRTRATTLWVRVRDRAGNVSPWVRFAPAR